LFKLVTGSFHRFRVLGIPSGGLQLLAHLAERFALDLPDALACQAEGFLVPNLLQASAALNTPLPLYGFNNSIDKEVRIRGLGPLLAQSRIRVRETPGGKMLVMQMRDFPMGEFVDCCDAAEMACRLLVHLTRKGAPSSQAPSLLR
jgi:predicted phage terminase large subunit-like protein